MRKREKQWRLLLACVVVALSAIVFCRLCLGKNLLSPLELFSLFSKGDPSKDALILRYARLPRTLACLLAGAALAVAGAILQNVLANDLASPGIIGVNAGAGLGVTLCCAAGLLSGWVISVSAFLGGLLAVLLIALFAGRGGVTKSNVILGGVALNSLLNAFCEGITVLVPDVSALNLEFRVGGFSSVTYARLLPASVLILVSLTVVFTLLHELDAVALGDDLARGIGLSVRFYRVLFLILAALLAGAAVSFAGLLGFLGLIVPHLCRILVGNESRKLLPLSALMGAGILTLSDTVMRLAFYPFELPVGIFMAVLGAPAFVMLLIRKKGGHGHA